MMATTFNEWKRNKTSLFTEINSLLETSIFDEGNLEFVDMAFSHLYGNRYIPSSMENDTVSEVAKKLVILNKQKWINSYDLLYNEIVQGVANETTVTEQGTTSNERQLDRNTKENVSAFNDVDYSPDSENVEGLTDNNNQTNTTTRTETKKSLWAVQEQLRISQQSFLQDVVFKDVSKIITLSVY